MVTAAALGAFLSLGGLATAASEPPPAGGRPPELSLRWRAPEGCPAAATVEAEFVRLLGGADRAASDKRLRVVATVRRLATEKWAVTLQTDVGGDIGRRTIEGDSCRAVTSAAALILAMTLDPEAASRSTERAASSPDRGRAVPAPAPPSSGNAPGGRSSSTTAGRAIAPSAAVSSPPPSDPAEASPPSSTPAAPVPDDPEPAVTTSPTPPAGEAPPAPEDEAPPPPERRPEGLVVTTPDAPPRTGPRLFLRAFAGATVALMPETAGVAGFAAGVKSLTYEGELSLLVSQAREAQAASRPSARADFRLMALGLRGCRRLGSGAVIPRLCLGGELERITGRTRGVETPSWGTALVAAGVVTGVLAIPMGQRVELAFELGLSARPYRPAFVVDNLGTVFAVPALAAFTSLGMAIKL
jgi:hypothetical protein